MTDIELNGRHRCIPAALSLTDLVAEVTGQRIGADGRCADGRRLGVAVARNAEVVPRSRWSTTLMTQDDSIEIITAMQGG